MEYRENPIYGRKIFFLNPPLSVENIVSLALKNDEFEVYIIRQYEQTKSLLRQNPNAICWIYIDDILSYEAWCNFIKSFEFDEELKSIFIGILTARAKPSEQEFFMLNVKLPGGFVRLDQKTEEITAQLKGILDINGARGVRKCIRLEVDETLDVNGYFSSGNNLFSFKVRHISQMGFAALAPASMVNLFKKGGFIKNVSITLGRYSFTCQIQIVKTTIVNKNCLILAYFTDNTSTETQKKIHDFVYQTLETRYKKVLENLSWDNTNYSICPSVGGPNEGSSEGEADAKAENKSENKTEDKTEGTSEVTSEQTSVSDKDSGEVSDVDVIEEMEEITETEPDNENEKSDK